MKKRFHSVLTFVVALGLLLAGTIVYAQKGQPHDPNPLHDPDVQRGYDEHQKEYNKGGDKDKGDSKGNNTDNSGGKNDGKGGPFDPPHTSGSGSTQHDNN
jgi:hypothetical protein